MNITNKNIKQTKTWRRDLDTILTSISNNPDRQSRPRSLAATKLEECIMWLGKDLASIGANNPYPESKNPESNTIEPTADKGDE